MYLHGCNYLGAGNLGPGSDWVRDYQVPFNNNILAPAAELAKTDPATAYQNLSAGFARIQADAVAWVSSMPQQARGMAQSRVDGWKSSDWPLIQGFLTDWSHKANTMPTAPAAAPTLLQVTGPAAGPVMTYTQPALPGIPSGGAAGTFVPTSAPPSDVFGDVAPAAQGGLFPPELTEWLPWVAGAALLGFLLTGGCNRSNRANRS